MMTFRRMGLLILGFVGSVISAGLLYLSVGGMSVAANDVGEINLQENLTFPVSIPETTLIAQSISSYEGPFLEDGSDREVVNIAALQVYNAGDAPILRAYVVFFFDDYSFVFYGENIPAGETVLLLERTAAKFQKEPYLGCSGWQELDYAARIDDKITVNEIAMGTVVVTNNTNQTFYNVQIYYKSFLSSPGIYIGGITYMTELPVLLPGQTQYLYPYHYASGYSKVVAVLADAF